MAMTAANAKSSKKHAGRIRAPRACQRCNQRKVQCDGARLGLPCSRCRVDNSSNCIFAPSRRGTYERKKAPSQPTQTSAAVTPPTLEMPSPSSVCTSDRDSATSDPYTVDQSVVEQDFGMPGFNNVCDGKRSLAVMFEDFLNQQRHPEGRVEKCGIIFLGESSPLTYALEELQRGKNPNLHDSSASLTHIDPPTKTNDAHPAHMTAPDIEYLKAKGAFEFPKASVLSSFVTAFIDKFLPLYSIVDKAEFQKLFEEQRLPWILVHAVCFVGATYCDQSAIHLSGFSGRWHARRLFYDKAKILFDLGYETNKIVLLQTVLMLTFWGPQMKSYWNPCSWIGFGVTIAVSLGIHRSISSAHMKATDRGLLRRLWWSLVARDTYCASLLGRPFRIDLGQSDTELLTLDDFSPEQQRQNDVAAIYQIQIAKLSLVQRQIVQVRFGPCNNSMTLERLRESLSQWQLELPPAVDWIKLGSQAHIFSTSLKIIYHHHIISIHLGKPDMSLDTLRQVSFQEITSNQIAESAAQVIASSALTLMTNTMIGSVPHEVFPGFFIAGIVFYRHLQQENNMLAQLGRAALDNCQMIMNEARERWDAAQWAMRIFEFLLSSSNKAEANAEAAAWKPSSESEMTPSMLDSLNAMADAETCNNMLSNNDMLHSIDLDSPQHQSMMQFSNDFMLLPNYFMTIPKDGMHMGF